MASVESDNLNLDTQNSCIPEDFFKNPEATQEEPNNLAKHNQEVKPKEVSKNKKLKIKKKNNNSIYAQQLDNLPIKATDNPPETGNNHFDESTPDSKNVDTSNSIEIQGTNNKAASTLLPKESPKDTDDTSYDNLEPQVNNTEKNETPEVVQNKVEKKRTKADKTSKTKSASKKVSNNSISNENTFEPFDMLEKMYSIYKNKK